MFHREKSLLIVKFAPKSDQVFRLRNIIDISCNSSKISPKFGIYFALGDTDAPITPIGEFGRIHKTKHILRFINDETYRRDILTQLNRGETENGLERIIMYGKKGELYKATREGQEDQLNALGLVSNIIVLWNTIYMEAALDEIQKAGFVVNESDKKRLSPLGNGHINIIGHYFFDIPQEVLEGKLRPLQSLNNKLFGIY